MAVTRSTAADRRQQETSTLKRPGFAVQGLPGAPSRNLEGLLLAAAALVVLLGLTLVYLAMVKPLADLEPKLAAGAIVNLNDLRSAEQLLPVLDVFDSSAERSFIAQEIWQRAHQGDLPNVGEIERIRVPAATIEKDRRLTSLRERLDARRAAGPQAAGTQAAGTQGDLSIPLFSLQQFRQVKPRLVVRSPGQFRSSFWLWSAVFLLSFAAVHVAWRLRRFAGDELILPALLLLAGLGLIMMVSVRDPLRDLPLYRGFAEGVLFGAALLFAASLFDFERSPLKRMSLAPLLAAFLLSGVLIVFGSGPGGSDAKVNLFGWQPVEAIKILVVLFLAGYFFDRWEFLRELRETRAGLPRALSIPKLEYLLPPLLAIGLVLLFFFLQRDLGPALILSFLFLTLYCVARGRPSMALLGTALVALAFAFAYKIGYPATVTGRLNMWISPWDNSFRGGDHLAQGLWSMAGGGLTGTGLGLGQPQRVPEIHTDLVLAAVGEQLGFLGLLAVVALYALLVWRGFRAAFRSGATYSFFLALGLSLLIAIQILLIAGGIFDVLPLSGVVSPFLSSGRTAMLANFLIFGIILGISARAGSGAGINTSAEEPSTASTRRFYGAARWAAVALGVVLAAIVLRAAQVQVFQSDRFLARGALTLQGDGYRRFEYNPRLVDIAQGFPRGDILDRNGVLLATTDPAQIEKNRAVLERLGATLPAADERQARGHRYYPFGGKTFHLLGDLNERTNWAATNTSYAERDSRIRLQGYDDFAGVADVRQPNGRITREIRLDYGELHPPAAPPLAAGPSGGAADPRPRPHAAADDRRPAPAPGRRRPGEVRPPGGLRRRRRGARPGDRRPPRLGELPVAGAAAGGCRGGRGEYGHEPHADRPRPLRDLSARLDLQDGHRHGGPAEESAARQPALHLQAPARRPGGQLRQGVGTAGPRRSHGPGAARRGQPGEGDRRLLQRLLRAARRLRGGAGGAARDGEGARHLGGAAEHPEAAQGRPAPGRLWPGAGGGHPLPDGPRGGDARQWRRHAGGALGDRREQLAAVAAGAGAGAEPGGGPRPRHAPRGDRGDGSALPRRRLPADRRQDRHGRGPGQGLALLVHRLRPL